MMFLHRGVTSCQVEHHMRTKFATPTLHAIDIFKSSNLVIFLYYVIDIVYIYSWEKFDKTLTHFGDATYQK